MSGPDLSETEHSSLRLQACDSCRARKIKCDRKSPCSSCEASHISCRTSKKSPEKRQRILVSGRYEREIENVNGRLASLERTLQTLVNHQRPNGPEPSPQPRPESLSTPRDRQVMERELDYEGDSSFVAHSKHVTQAFEKSLGSNPYSNSNSAQDVSAAVATLRSFLNENSPSADGSVPLHKPLQEAVQYPELSNLDLPPMQPVLHLLRWCKTHPHRFFYETPLVDVAYVTNLCQKIYFPTEEYTIATFITAHISLFYLFRQITRAAAQELNLTSTEITQMVATCSRNAETAMRNVRLYMEASYENIEALLFASMLAMELSRPSFAWTLITTAARMVQDAGYHRLPNYAVAPEATKKRLLFWFIYTLDRSMALNLGRSPSLQDCDITVERPKIPEEINGGYGAMYAGYMEVAELQGHIYEQLYCARAQKQPTEVKAKRARDLAERVLKTKQLFVFDLTGFPFPEALQESLFSNEIVLGSMLTLVYRMIPPAPLPSNRPHHPLKFCDEALHAAREALALHNEAWNALKHRAQDEWELFLHWTLLWCPFIPYIVVFGNVIADRNAEDLGLLEQVVDTLQSAGGMSLGVRKLYRACRIFYQIGTMYLGQGDRQQNASNQSSSQPPVLPSGQIPPQPTTSSSFQPELHYASSTFPDLPLFPSDLDGMLDAWDLGRDGGDGRDMSTFLEQYFYSSGPLVMDSEVEGR